MFEQQLAMTPNVDEWRTIDSLTTRITIAISFDFSVFGIHLLVVNKWVCVRCRFVCGVARSVLILLLFALNIRYAIWISIKCVTHTLWVTTVRAYILCSVEHRCRRCVWKCMMSVLCQTIAQMYKYKCKTFDARFAHMDNEHWALSFDFVDCPLFSFGITECNSEVRTQNNFQCDQ